MNNFDVLKNDNSIVRCKDCHFCLTGTFKNSPDHIYHLCSRVADLMSYVSVDEDYFCDEGCLNITGNDNDRMNYDIVENNKAVVRCMNCVWWDKDHNRCDHVKFTTPVLEKIAMPDYFCAYGDNGKEEDDND